MVNATDHALSSITLTGSAGSFEPGDYSLTNLLVPGDTLNITVNASYEILGLTLDAHEVAIYGFPVITDSDSGLGQLPDAGPRLGRNYPNPFNPSTTITFTLPSDSHVNISIYDVQGKPVKTVKDEVAPEGYNEVLWDGSDDRGEGVGSGVYFCRMTAGDRAMTRKMVLLR